MMEMREVLEREGREARNLMAYHLSIFDDFKAGLRKPPVVPKVASKKLLTHTGQRTVSTGARVRSASTGRDKRSELQARYWALLFDNLKRAINEIYQTVECYENISSCQEAILVLENYVRDFKALAEWFRVSWDYEATAQRQQSLTWDVRKSNPMPRLRAKSLSSPSPPILSGKSSPCPSYSGKNSPCSIGDDTKLSPRKKFLEQIATGANTNDSILKIPNINVDNVKALKSPRSQLTKIKEDLAPAIADEDQTQMNHLQIEQIDLTQNKQPQVDLKISIEYSGQVNENNMSWNEMMEMDEREMHPTQIVPLKCHQYSQTDLDDDNLTLIQWREKYENPIDSIQSQSNPITAATSESISESPPTPAAAAAATIVMLEHSAVEATIMKMNAMENEFLQKDENTAASKSMPELILPKTSPIIHAAPKSPKTVLTKVVPPDAMQKPFDRRPNSALLNHRPATSNPSTIKSNPIASRSATMIRSTRYTASPIIKPTTTITTTTTTAAAAAAAPTLVASQNSFRKTVPPKPATQTFTTTTTVTTTSTTTSTKYLSQKDSNLKREMISNEKGKGPRPSISNMANRLTARSKTMIDMSNRSIKNRYQSNVSFNSRKSREDVLSSSSTLKASTEQISANTSRGGSTRSLVQHPRNDAKYRRSEPKTTTVDENNDGWLTVKARRRSSLHWANRFNQPTGYASLPTLIMPSTTSDAIPVKSSTNGQQAKKEKKPLKKMDNKQCGAVDASTCAAAAATKSKSTLNDIPKMKGKAIKEMDTKVSRVQSQKSNSIKFGNTTKASSSSTTATDGKAAAVAATSKGNGIVSREIIMQRQKSDLTGLKITKLHKEFMRNEKFNNKTKSATTPPDPEPIQNRIDMKVQTTIGLSKAITDLYQSEMRNVKCKMNGQLNDPNLTSSCDDETDERDDIESDEDQRKLHEEQCSLEQQIRDLEMTEIDVDTETDETDCDCEVILDIEETDDGGTDLIDDHLSMDNDDMSLEMRYQLLLSDLSIGERVETLATLQAYVSRHPGRAQELHKKLSSPSRRRSLQETLKKYQAKQARAQAKREALMKEKAVKLQVLLARVEDVKSAKQQLIDEKRLRMEERLQRATDNRTQYLKDKIRKAHDEEAKSQEIAFIKNLEARIKKLDFMESCKEQEGRLQDLEQERQKKAEEKAAKEAAVERRRTELELERQRRLEKMNETRREREQRIGQMQEQKEKMRQEIARTKAKDREERLLALQVQQQQTTEELQRKINQKQQESARRHEENIEHIRQRALELSIPIRNVDENGQRVDSADRGGGGGGGGADGGDEDLSSVVSDVSKEYQSKANKKRIKKLKQRMALKTEEYVSEQQQLPAYMRRDSEVPKLLAIIKKGGGPLGIERPLGQLLRLMAKAQVFDFQCFWLLDGLGVVSKVIENGCEPNTDVSKKAVILAVQIYRDSCSPCPQIARHAILGNSIITICDVLLQSLQTPDERTPLHPVEMSTELMLACTVALSPSSSMKQQTHPKVLDRLPDLISYIVAIGLVDVLSKRCLKIREVVENHQNVILSLLATLGLLTKIAELCPKAPDITKFLASIKSTDLFGSISLLHSTVVPVGECIPPRTISLAAATFNLLVTVANLDLPSFQSVLGDDSLCFQFMDVVRMLLKYCGPKCQEKGETQAVVIDLVATIGFFCANNTRNQNLITSEQSSIIIKNLTKLPKAFEMVIYPTLLTIITGNADAETVVSRDFSLDFLKEYQQSELAKKNKLISLIN